MSGITKQVRHRKGVTALNRRQLGTIDLSDAQDVEKMSSSDRRTYLEQAEMLFKNPVLVAEIAFLIQQQLEFVANTSEDFDQVLVGRGTINGLSLFSERIQLLHTMHEAEKESKSESDEPDNEFGVVGEL